jgi:ADP-heptose:LPS heptosyltransferase
MPNRVNKQYLKILWWAMALSQFDSLASRASGKRDAGKVLVVRLDGIGDFVLWLDAAAGLRTLYPAPHYRITLLGNRLWTTVAQAQSMFDEVWEMDLKRFAYNPGYRFHLMRQVAEAGFSIAINPTFGRDFLWGDAIIRASQAPQRIGIDGLLDRMSAAGRSLSNRWYTRLLSASQAQTELERNADFIRVLGSSSFECSLPKIKVKGTNHPTLVHRDYYVLAPFAGYAIRRWPLDNFRRVAELLFAETGWLGVVCGGSRDREGAKKLVSATNGTLLDYTGRVGLSETLAIIAGSRLILGNETGLTHLAAGAGTPFICILGGGHYGRFLPYPSQINYEGQRFRTVTQQMDCFGCNWRCVFERSTKQPAPCIEKISVESVWQKTLSLVRSIRASQSTTG